MGLLFPASSLFSFVLFCVLFLSLLLLSASSRTVLALDSRTVSASGDTIDCAAGGSVTDPAGLELKGALGHGASLTIQNCDFGANGVLRVQTTMQRGAIVTIQKNKLKGLKFDPQASGTSVCSSAQPQNNDDLLRITIKENTVSSPSSPDGALYVDPPILCGTDAEAAAKGGTAKTAGLALEISENRFEPPTNTAASTFAALRVFRTAPTSNVPFAKIESIVVRANIIKATFPQSSCMGIVVGWNQQMARGEILFRAAEPSAAAGPTRRVLIERNEISLNCKQFTFAPIAAGNFGSEPLAAGLDYTSVNLEITVSENVLDLVSAERVSGILVVPKLYSKFFDRGTDGTLSYNGKSLDDASNFVIPSLSVLFYKNQLTLDTPTEQESQQSFGIEFNMASVHSQLVCRFSSNIITFYGFVHFAAFKLTGIQREIFGDRNAAKLREEERRPRPFSLRARTTFFSMVRILDAAPMMELPAGPYRRIQAVRFAGDLTSTSHLYAKDVQLLHFSESVPAVDDVTLDNVKLEHAGPPVRSRLSAASLLFAYAPRFGNLSLSSCAVSKFISANNPSLVRLDRGSNNVEPFVKTLVLLDSILAAKAQRPFQDEDDAEKNSAFDCDLVKMKHGGSVLRVDIRNATLSCVGYGAVRFFSGVSSSAVMRITDSRCTAECENAEFLGTASLRVLSISPTYRSNAFFPRMNLARNTVEVSTLNSATFIAFACRVATDTNGNPAFRSVAAQLSLAPLGIHEKWKEDFVRDAFAAEGEQLDALPIYPFPLVSSPSFFIETVLPLILNTTTENFPPWVPTTTTELPAEVFQPSWVVSNNDIKLRSLQRVIILSFGGLVVPPLQLELSNSFETEILSESELPRTIPNRAVAEVAAAALVLGISAEKLEGSPVARFAAGSYSEFESIVLAPPGARTSSCSRYNGRRVSDKLVRQQLAINDTGISAMLLGSGFTPPNRYTITPGSCGFTATFSLRPTRSRSAALTPTENATLTYQKTRTQTNTTQVFEQPPALQQASEFASVMLALGAAATVLSVGVSGVGAFRAVRAQYVMAHLRGLAIDECGAESSDEPPGFMSSPLQFNFGESGGGYTFGTVIGNPIFLLIVLLLCLLVFYCWQRWVWKRSSEKFLSITGTIYSSVTSLLLVKSMALPVLLELIQILFYPTQSSAMTLVVSRESSVMLRLAGVLFAIANIVFLGRWMWRDLWKRHRYEKFHRILEERARRAEERQLELEGQAAEMHERRRASPGLYALEEADEPLCKKSMLPCWTKLKGMVAFVVDPEGEWRVPSRGEIREMLREQEQRARRRSSSSRGSSSNNNRNRVDAVPPVDDKDREEWAKAAPTIEPFTDRLWRFMVVEFALQFAFSLFVMIAEAMPKGRNGCLVRGIFTIVALFFYGTVVAVKKPYQDRWSYYTVLVMVPLEMLVLILGLAKVPPSPTLEVGMYLLSMLQFIAAVVPLFQWVISIAWPWLTTLLVEMKRRRGLGIFDEPDDPEKEYLRVQREMAEATRAAQRPEQQPVAPLPPPLAPLSFSEEDLTRRRQQRQQQQQQRGRRRAISDDDDDDDDNAQELLDFHRNSRNRSRSRQEDHRHSSTPPPSRDQHQHQHRSNSTTRHQRFEHSRILPYSPPASPRGRSAGERQSRRQDQQQQQSSNHHHHHRSDRGSPIIHTNSNNNVESSSSRHHRSSSRSAAETRGGRRRLDEAEAPAASRNRPREREASAAAAAGHIRLPLGENNPMGPHGRAIRAAASQRDSRYEML